MLALWASPSRPIAHQGVVVLDLLHGGLGGQGELDHGVLIQALQAGRAAGGEGSTRGRPQRLQRLLCPLPASTTFCSIPEEHKTLHEKKRCNSCAERSKKGQGAAARASAPGARELGVPAAHKGLRAVEDHAVARLAGLLELALLDGLGGLGRLALVCRPGRRRQGDWCWAQLSSRRTASLRAQTCDKASPSC